MFFSRNTRLRKFLFQQLIGTGLGVLAEAVRNRVLGNTTTNIYDNFGRITGTSLANGSGVVYTYTKGQLSELSRRTGSTTQNYSFICNSFGRMTSGGQPVARERSALADLIGADINAVFIQY